MSRGYLNLVAGVGLAVFLCSPPPALGQTAPTLGTAEGFAVLGGSTVTNTGPTVVTGNLGVSPGTAITGFPPGTRTGATFAGDAVALQAQTDATAAYLALAGQVCPPANNLTGQDLGTVGTLTPGVYCFDTSAQLTGTLTLDSLGDPSAVFIFQMGSTLTTASNAVVSMTNPVANCNVFWQVGSSATLGTNTTLVGSILALASITLNTGASVSGRTLAQTGAVTLDSSTVGSAACVAAAVCPPITISPATLPNATVGTAFSQTLTGNGGTAPYTFSLISGALPAGITLTSAGVLAGTPTAAGTFTFTIRATDANVCPGENPYTLTVLTAVPTLTQWATILLTLLLVLAGYMAMRARTSLRP